MRLKNCLIRQKSSSLQPHPDVEATAVARSPAWARRNRKARSLLALGAFSIAFGVGPAAAQVSLTQSPSLPDTSVLNRASCDAEAEEDKLFLRWILTGTKPTYTVIFRSFVGDELPSNNCPALINTNFEGEDILSSPFDFVPDGLNEMDIQFEVFPRQLAGADACTEAGIRDTQRTLCLYVADVNSGLEEFRTTLGYGVSVDTSEPGATSVALVGSDGRFTASMTGPTAEGGEVLSYEVQYRGCASDADAGTVTDDAGTTGDGGSKSADPGDGDKFTDEGDGVFKGGLADGGALDVDGGAVATDGGVADGGALDAGALDGGAIDGGAIDGGAIVDAGAFDAGPETFNDAGVQVAETDVTGPSDCGAVTVYRVETGDGPDIVVNSLANGVTYEVRVRAVDDFGNAGPFSTRQQIVPVAEQGFLSIYDGEADPLSFDPTPILEGCVSRAVTSGDTPWSILALLIGGGLLFRRRRQRRHALKKLASGTTTALALLLGFGGIPPAHAALGDVTVQVGVGPYTPALDEGKAFPAYGCLYKDGQIIPRLDVDVGLHIFDAFGSVQLNLGVGASQARGKAQPVGGPRFNPNTERFDCLSVSEDATQVELTQFTLRPGLSYRADQLLDFFAIPLVPYARVGLLLNGYAFTKGGLYDNAGVGNGINPAGLRLGVEGALGLMLALDWWDYVSPLSENITKRAQALGVFQHAFFYAEVVAQSIDSFGLPGPNLSPTDRVFGTGLPFFFNVGAAMEF